jgi:hypothetical protein
MDFFELIYFSAIVYAITKLVTESSIFHYPRELVKKLTPWIRSSKRYHFIECRLCINVWVSLAIVYYFMDGNSHEELILNTLSILGISFFMVMKENRCQNTENE